MPPLYEARCPKCGKIHIYRASINERDKKTPMCCKTNSERKMITPPMGKVIGPAA